MTIQSMLPDGAALIRNGDGLALQIGDQTLRGDFSHMMSRIKPGKLREELIVRAARGKSAADSPTLIDATAGLGEDSFLLAAAGFSVTLYEHNPIIHALLADALRRASEDEALAGIVARMTLIRGDSIESLRHCTAPPDVILLDPMFPERQKSSLVKKKLQILQKLEIPCDSEDVLFSAALAARPGRLIVKRPPKGPYLAGYRPDYSLTGKAVRFDCFVTPADKNLKKEEH